MADGGGFHGARAPMEFAVFLKFAGPEIDSFPLICPDADQRAEKHAGYGESELTFLFGI